MRKIFLLLALVACLLVGVSSSYAQNLSSGIITTSASTYVETQFSGQGCVGISVTGIWSGGPLPVQQSIDHLTWTPVDNLQQISGKWQESIGSNGTYYSGGYSTRWVRVAGPTGSGSATVWLQTSSQSCNQYVFSIPGAEAGNGFFGGAVAATGTQTTVPDSIQGHGFADVQVVWSGISGSPSGCAITMSGSDDGVNYVPVTVQAVTPGTPALFSMDGAMGLAVEFIYTCAGYPAAGTIQIEIVYKGGAKRVSISNTPSVNLLSVNSLTVDPCLEAKAFPISLHITGATTTLGIPVASGKTPFICGMFATLLGTGTQTIKLVGGTQATNPCDTGQFAITPAWSTTATTGFQIGNLLSNSELGFGGLSGQVCVVTTGTVTADDVYIAYIQQ